MSGSSQIAIETDFLREWGVKLLKDNDKAFQDPEYRRNLEEASRLGTISFYGSSHRYGTALSRFYKEYLKAFEFTDSYGLLNILRFTNTGTEANNVFYEFAEHAYFQRTGKRAKRANLLYFGRPYGGTFGRVAEISTRYQTDAKVRRNFQIPTPHTRHMYKQTTTEAARLDKIETEALEFIRKQVAKTSLEIGGIFLEPISVSNGLYFFRPKFLEKLRVLADELNVPIMADEIFTGGGRTGKFWASAHYGTFRPDLISFGKGLGVSGVAEYRRGFPPKWKWPSFENTDPSKVFTYPNAVLDNTSRVHPLVLVQALTIIKRLSEKSVMQNVQEVGAYALEKIKHKAEQMGFGDEVYGIGLLFDVGSHTEQLAGPHKLEHYNGRWTPPVTSTKQEFDILLND